MTPRVMRRSSGTMTTPARMAPQYRAGRRGVAGDQVSSRSPATKPRARSLQAASIERCCISAASQGSSTPWSVRRLHMGGWDGQRVAASSRMASSEG